MLGMQGVNPGVAGLACSGNGAAEVKGDSVVGAGKVVGMGLLLPPLHAPPTEPA